jgi:hypothetical protein
MSLISKNVGLLAGVAIVLASGSAFALTNHQAPASSRRDLSGDTTLAADLERETKPQETKPNTQASTDSRFSCQLMNGQYTVMYHPISQPDQSYAWATPSVLGGGWTPERRCNEISRRLELYRPDGLQEMQTSVENGYNIVCATTQKDSTCRIVLTVPPGQDPQLTLNRVFENLTIADSGQQTQGVNTYVERNRGSGLLNQVNQVLNQGLSALGIGNNSLSRSGTINLRPFLDQIDGGTGTQLQRGIRTQPNPQLNPDRFR